MRLPWKPCSPCWSIGPSISTMIVSSVHRFVDIARFPGGRLLWTQWRTVLPAERPSVVVLAGPNGAGKSTLPGRLLVEVLDVTEFVDADLLARSLPPSEAAPRVFAGCFGTATSVISCSSGCRQPNWRSPGLLTVCAWEVTPYPSKQFDDAIDPACGTSLSCISL